MSQRPSSPPIHTSLRPANQTRKMSKRIGKPCDSRLSTPSKRAKLDVTITSSQQAGQTVKKTPVRKEPDDLWGADFNEEDIVEMDIIASQVCNVVRSQILIVYFSLLYRPTFPLYRLRFSLSAYRTKQHSKSLRHLQPRFRILI